MAIDELQQLIDRELKALPAPRAPQTLLPRVLAATVHAKPGRWYARPWLEWPRRWQLASATVLLALGIGLAIVVGVGPGPHSPAGPPGVSAVADRILRPLATVAVTLEQASALVRACWAVLLAPIASWLLVMALSLSLACGALWSALERNALGGAQR